MPFAVAERDGVLTLTLDTPGSLVNVFNRATAEQLLDVLGGVTPARTRAIVLETAKVGSFVNGVGLLLAHATRTREDVERASALPWAAYRALREAPVPTIAVVQGSCFGCGVELVLNCDYRLAVDTCETRFYMTELNDYLFVPLFGSTWNLPEAVGLDDAIELLLWGARWDATTAHARGLVDDVAPWDARAARRDAFVARVVAGTQPSRRRGPVLWGAVEDAAVERARRRIAALPAPYRPVYGDALALLEAGARRRTTFLDHQRAELRASGESALAPIGKAAYAFFYLRQMAGERAAGRDATPAPLTLAADLDGDVAARALVRDLRGRTLPGVAFADGDGADVRLVSPRCAPTGDGLVVAVHAALAATPAADVALYAPAHAGGGRLVELATRGGAREDRARLAALARALQRFGFEVAHTTPADGFVTNALLRAYLAPLVRAVAAGRDPAALNAALRTLGFVRLPSDVVAGLDRAALAALVAPAAGAAPADVADALARLAVARCPPDAGDPAVIDALAVSLAAAVSAARDRRDVRDPTIADLVARELLDFPRHLCSLATWLERARVARALAADVRSLVSDEDIAAARAFVDAGREFYR